MPHARRIGRLCRRLHPRPWTLSFLAVLLFVGPAHAQNDRYDRIDGGSEPAVPEKAGKVLQAFRLDGTRPRIDGHLDEAFWARADSLDDLVQWEPDNMEPFSERTVIRIAYDDRHLYVAVRCYDSEPDAIATGLGRRDDVPRSDRIFIGFDPQHDHLTGYVFATNPSGVLEDFRFFDDDESDSDYDAVWEARTRIDDDGWTAEFRVPFSQMRFQAEPGREAVWGFGLRRIIQRKGEEGQWVGRPRGEQGQVSRWGHLVFEEGLEPTRRLEVLPFTLARREQLSATRHAEHEFDAGIDLRVGLGSAATLSATVNPDFGQVEADPAVLNLSVFETFFPEKRPFFLEDSRTFVPPYGLFRLFHSRRIGRSPGRFAVQETDVVVERPGQTTLLGAAKVTGKSSGWTYGVLTSATAREYAIVDSVGINGAGEETITRRERLIEPLTSYNVARLQRDVLGGSSNIGVMATAVVRERDEDAFTGGIDYKLRFDRNRFEWNGHWAATRAPGDGGVRTGFGGVTNVSYDRKHFELWTHFDHFAPDFRVNDIGFQRSRNDRTAFDIGLELEQPDPFWTFRDAELWTSGGQAWTTDRLVFDRWISAGIEAQLKNYWYVSVNGGRGFETLDDLDTRGGPPIVSPAAYWRGLHIRSDSRKSWRASLWIGRFDSEAGSRDVSLSPSLSLQPSPRLQTRLSVNYSNGRDVAQWIANGDFDDDDETDYVYGSLGYDVVSVTLRSTYAIHRDLSLQLFLQPFVAVGDYTDIRELVRPRSFQFQPIGIDFDPDFHSKSLRGTIVARWEYLRGSTLFFVWNLSTFDDANPGRFDLWRDLGDAFDAAGDHIFMVKANYWMSL